MSVSPLDPYRRWGVRLYSNGTATVEDLAVLLAGGDEAAELPGHPAHDAALAYLFALEGAGRIRHLADPALPIRERPPVGTFGPVDTDQHLPDWLSDCWPSCPSCCGGFARVRREGECSVLRCLSCGHEGTPNAWSVAASVREARGPGLAKASPRTSAAPARASPPPQSRDEPAPAPSSPEPPKRQAAFEWAAPQRPNFAASGGRR